LIQRASRFLVNLARFGNTQLSYVRWFGFNVLQRQFDLLLFCINAPSRPRGPTGHGVGLGDNVAATIRLIATALVPPHRSGTIRDKI